MPRASKLSTPSVRQRGAEAEEPWAKIGLARMQVKKIKRRFGMFLAEREGKGRLES
jgi:hypothetical protein